MDFAKENHYIIITNDSDFVNLISVYGFPPKVVLLLTRNQSTQYLYDLLIAKQAEIKQLNSTNEYGIIEIFPPRFVSSRTFYCFINRFVRTRTEA